LFGVLNYSGKEYKEVNNLVNCLAQEATIRGMDSTGIAYNKDGKLRIYKKPLSAYEMEFKGLENCVCITGHTRHATQGSEKKNYNNHPFIGYCDNVKFALSHNGVLWNDRSLRTTYGIEPNKIETDSYIAVQLLEHFGTLIPENVAKMSEAVRGSFSFTMTDTRDTLWLVKGDSPLSIIHLPFRKMYVYASTDEILYSALSHTSFVNEIIAKDFEKINIHAGTIMRITKDGTILRDKFKYVDDYSYGYDWRNYRSYAWDEYDGYGSIQHSTIVPQSTVVSDCASDGGKCASDIPMLCANPEYLQELYALAVSLGFCTDEVDELLNEGFTLEEIEEYLYDFDYNASYVS
jgi:glucosamine 6-phosphate synthetase-like amidotransferase/phosphosugar isomerase protein